MLIDAFRGLHLPPWVVALVRGFAEAVVFAGILFLINYLDAGDVPDDLRVWAPILVLLLRQLEGVADQIDPAKRRRTR